MGKFVFKLQSLLNVKEQMEESLKNELGKALQRLEYEKDVLRKIEQERDAYIARQNDEAVSGIAVGKLREYGAYISHLKEKSENQKENINLARYNVDSYREQLVKAVQEKEMLLKLKEKKYQDYLKELLRQEQKTNDEIISYNYTKSITEGQNG